MPPDYKTKDGDWISKISKSLGHTDGGKKLWDANPGIKTWTSDNRDVLDVGWTLKDPGVAQGQKPGGTSQQHDFVIPSKKKQLILTFYEHLGGSHPSVDVQLYIGNKLVFSDDSFTGKITIPFVDKSNTVLIDEATVQDALLVVQVNRRGVKHGPPQKVKLHIGGLTQLCKSDGTVSVSGLQKVLTNLGYAPGDISGVYSPATQAAVRAFQADQLIPVTSVPDGATCSKLLAAIETPMRRPMKFPGANDATFPGANDPDVAVAIGSPLQLGKTEYFQKNALWDPFEAWIDHAAPSAEAVANNAQAKQRYRVLKGDQTGLIMYDATRQSNDPPDFAFGGVPKEGVRFWPTDAYVAPSDAGDDSNKNPIWMLKYRSVFLDCGGWIKDQYDFAVIHGWHAYLCNYIPKEKRTGGAIAISQPSSGPLRMDHKFFQAIGGGASIVNCISTVWGNKAEFDWQNVTVIIPDVHLMTGVTANVWKPNTTDANGPFYDLRAELNLFAFAQEIVAAPDLQQNVNVIQLGDTFDLWIGSPNILGHDEPLFTQNKSSSVTMEQAVNIQFGAGFNYLNNKDKVVANWAGCIDVNFDPTNVDMRIQVLQWWVEAIKGIRNTPLEQRLDLGFPDPDDEVDPDNEYGMQTWIDASKTDPQQPWVEWILKRRSSYNSAELQKLRQIRQDYVSGKASGNTTAESLAAEFPTQFALVPNKPTMLRGVKVNPLQPNILDVRRWCSSIENQLTVFEEGCAGYVKYVGSDLNMVWLNPAVAALELLKTKYNGIQYLYGNHDNYLIRPEVRGNVCDDRVRFIEDQNGVFIEHAHRMEPGLSWPANANYDGNQKGYTLTNGVWRPRAEKMIPGVEAKLTEPVMEKVGEQADSLVTGSSKMYYRREAGRFLVARSVTGGAVPYIFVIGHTHAPSLDVNYVHLNDGTDFRGPGNESWGNDEGI